jgi:LCP family protein required for cell wall assembly
MFAGQALKEDKYGRTNILVFGTSEDDAGHSGAALTDSMMVISLDQDKKVASMVSMPRDLWVKYDTDCEFGYEGKINVVYECAGAVDGDLNNIDVATGAQALQNKIGEVFGMDVQYYVKVNYSVVRDVTTALDGVTVNVEAAGDSEGIYDSNTKLKLPNGPATLKGEEALAFVRARGEGAGSYGLNGNFSREVNQQKMVVAIRDKALSAGTLSNPVAVDGLINSLGNNIRTNFVAAEIKTLVNLAKDIPSDGIKSISLVATDNPMVTTGPYKGQSIVRPIAGVMDYSEIQAYIREQIDGGSVASEKATIEVLNGSQTVGAAATKQTELSQAGFLNISIGDSSYTPDSSLVWYDRSEGKKPKTTEQLAATLGKASAGSELPSGVQSDADFVIILGN